MVRFHTTLHIGSHHSSIDNIFEPSKNVAKISGGVTEFYFCDLVILCRKTSSISHKSFLFLPIFLAALQSHCDNDVESSFERETLPE